MVILENIVTDIDIDMNFLENMNIDIDKILYQLEFGISNRAIHCPINTLPILCPCKCKLKGGKAIIAGWLRSAISSKCSKIMPLMLIISNMKLYDNIILISNFHKSFF